MAAQGVLSQFSVRLRRSAALACALAALAVLSPSYANSLNARSRTLPDLMLWAWERPEDLRGLDRRIGVAFLAQTIRIATSDFIVVPRRQPLRVAPETMLVAVTRIETGRAAQPDRTDIDSLASAILRTTTLPRIAVVQIDFDAVASERTMYAHLIRRVRQQLEPSLPLSVTALASWCKDDDWLGDLPADEVVPMLFRMGPANEPFRSMARSPRQGQPACRHAIGTSLDEPIAVARDRRRRYVFSPKAWTPQLVEHAARGLTP
jgi:hypothetical protein